MKVVIDTNVLVSGLINPGGKPARIIDLLLNGKLILLYDNRILNEYSDVLYRKKFNFSDALVAPLLAFITHECEYVTAIPLKIPFQDESDKMFLEVAETGNAEFLLTGNKDHFPKRKNIITPAEFFSGYY